MLLASTDNKNKGSHMRFIALCLVFLAAPAANAAIVKYEYTGAEYDYVADPTDPSVGANPYLERTQNHISGFFLLDTDQLLGETNRNGSFAFNVERDDCQNCAQLPDWQFFDGLFHERFDAWSVGANFEFTTDAAGDIATWSIFLYDEYHDMWIADWGDERYHPSCGNWEPDFSTCVSSSKPGTWRQVPVPEPGALGMIAFGVLAAFRLRRSRARA